VVSAEGTSKQCIPPAEDRREKKDPERLENITGHGDEMGLRLCSGVLASKKMVLPKLPNSWNGWIPELVRFFFHDFTNFNKFHISLAFKLRVFANNPWHSDASRFGDLLYPWPKVNSSAPKKRWPGDAFGHPAWAQNHLSAIQLGSRLEVCPPFRMDSPGRKFRWVKQHQNY